MAEPEIQTQGSDQIVVALPGADNPEQVVNDLIQPAQLVFINFEANVVDQAGTPKLSDAIALANRTPPKGTRPGARATFYAMDKDGNYLFGPAPDRQSLAENFPGNQIPAGVKRGQGAEGPLPGLRGAGPVRPAAATPAPSSGSGTSSRTTRACSAATSPRPAPRSRTRASAAASRS